MNSKNLNDEILCIKTHNYNVGQHQRFHYTNAFLLPSDNQLLNQIANPPPPPRGPDGTQEQSVIGKQPDPVAPAEPDNGRRFYEADNEPVKPPKKGRGRPKGSKNKGYPPKYKPPKKTDPPKKAKEPPTKTKQKGEESSSKKDTVRFEGVTKKIKIKKNMKKNLRKRHDGPTDEL